MMNKMSSITFPDGSSYEVTDDKARKDITEINNNVSDVQGAIDELSDNVADVQTRVDSKIMTNAGNSGKLRYRTEIIKFENGNATINGSTLCNFTSIGGVFAMSYSSEQIVIQRAHVLNNIIYLRAINVITDTVFTGEIQVNFLLIGV